MSAFTEQIQIDASIVAVWESLGNLAAIATWNPGVVAARLTSAVAGEIGATRECDLPGNHFLHEEVIEWVPLERLTMRVTSTDLPLQRADIQFTLKQQGDGTIVRVRPDYDLKYGLFGILLDMVLVRRRYMKAMRALLTGLKEHCE